MSEPLSPKSLDEDGLCISFHGCLVRFIQTTLGRSPPNIASCVLGRSGPSNSFHTEDYLLLLVLSYDDWSFDDNYS